MELGTTRLLLISARPEAEAALRSCPEIEVVAVVTLAGETVLPSSELFDVVAIGMGASLFVELSSVFRLHNALGFPRIVFLCDEAGSPEHLALHSCGLGHVLPSSEAAVWLKQALPVLTALVRGYRLIHRARVAGHPSPPLPPPDCGLRLAVAETQFREAYLRALLARHRTRRAAAAAAGVPYRSFCEMLRKLGLGDEYNRQNSRLPGSAFSCKRTPGTTPGVSL